jgi:RHS repeat-associated protein
MSHGNKSTSTRWTPSGRSVTPLTRNPRTATGSRACRYRKGQGHPVWLNRDPIFERGGLNLYVFAGSSPLNAIDPTGKCAVVLPALAWLAEALGVGIGAETAVLLGGSAVAVGAGVGIGIALDGGPQAVSFGSGAYYGDSKGGINAPATLLVGPVLNAATYRPSAKPTDAPAGTKPINVDPRTKNRVHPIKDQVKADGVGPDSYVGVSPEGNIIVTNPDGTAEDLGPFEDYCH